MDVTVLAMLKHHSIFKEDQMLLLNAGQLETHLLSFVGFRKANHDQVTYLGAITLVETYPEDPMLSVSATT